jgi:hypothetical protein
MRRIVTLLSLAVIALFAFGAVAVSAASAEVTKILPEPTAAAPLTAKVTQSVAGDFLTVGGLEVKCTKGSGSSTWTTANLGTGLVLSTECTGPLSTTCTGEGDPAGLISAEGEVHFWLALLMTGTAEKETTELIGAIVTLLKVGATPKPVKFTCVNAKKTIEDRIEVTGCAAAQILPASLNALIKEAKGESAEWKSGETQILQVLPQGTTSEINCLPTISTNGGAGELAAATGKATAGTFEKGGKEITIELMNP